jgi:hypothetical protein
MKRIGYIVFVVVSVGVLVAGKMHWNNKIASATAAAHTTTKIEETKPQPKKVEEVTYTQHLPNSVADKVKNVATTKKPLNMVMVHSGKGEWITPVQQGIEATYGKGVWNISSQSYASDTSSQLIAGTVIGDVVKANPEVILFEAPALNDNLNDNGKINGAESLKNMEKLIQEWQKQLPNAAILIQPGQPLYNAVNYPIEIANVKKFAEDKGYTYIDHWTKWPDYKTDKFLPYLAADKRTLNEQGHALWAEQITNYFVGK